MKNVSNPSEAKRRFDNGCWIFKNSQRFLSESIGGKEKILLGCWIFKNSSEVSCSNPSEAKKRFDNGCGMRRNPLEVSTWHY